MYFKIFFITAIVSILSVDAVAKEPLKNQKSTEEIIHEFVLKNLPKELFKSYDILSNLKYPIKNKKELRTQLQQYNEQEEITIDGINLILYTLQPQDFIIATPIDAIEKLTRGLSAFLNSEGMFIPLAGGFPPNPLRVFPDSDPCSQAVRKFYRECYEASFSEADFRDCLILSIQKLRQCQKNLKFYPPMDLCSLMNAYPFAECLVSGQEPGDCGNEYVKSVNQCRHEQLRPRFEFERPPSLPSNSGGE